LNNRDLIIKTARRLDKFTLDEMVVVSGVDEQELIQILSSLINEKIIVKNNNSYFFITNNSDNKEVNCRLYRGCKPRRPLPLHWQKMCSYP